MERMAPLPGPSIRAKTPQDWTIRRFADTMTVRRLEDLVAPEKMPQVRQQDEGEIVVLHFSPACPADVIIQVREKLASDGYSFDPPEAA